MPTQNAKRDENYVTTLIGVDSLDLTTPELLTVDSATNRLLVSAVITSSSFTVDSTPTFKLDPSDSGETPKYGKVDSSGNLQAGSVLTGPNVGQTTSNTSAVQLQVGSIPAKNGMLVQAISTNAASVFIGGSGVTTGSGFELQAGQAVPFTAPDINVLYVIGANGTDKVCWNVL